MIGILFVALVAIPVAELWVIVQVADVIGVLETVALLVAVSVAGAWLLKQQGTATWRRFNAALARGEVPTKEATDGALILFGGALLLTPGFLTDVVGLVLVAPPTRAAVKGAAARTMARWARRRFARRSRTVTVVRARRRAGGATTGVEGELPRATDRRTEGDSPDRS